MKKLLAILLALAMILCFAACGEKQDANNDSPDGGNTDTGDKAPEVKGEQKSWGEISVFVPEGYNLNGGSITGVDDEDPKQCYMQTDPASMYDYFWIITKDEESALADIEMTKSLNNAEDLTLEVDGKTWKGCSYVYSTSFNGDVTIGSVCCTIDGATYVVNFSGHAPDSPEMTAILGSVKAP